MSGRFITSAEVAARAGVSRSAVSRSFTPGASVSAETRARVLAAAEELGYRVNMLARTLHRPRSNLVGVIAGTISAPYIAGLIDHLSAALREAGLQCLLLNSRGSEAEMGAVIARMLEYRVRAVVVLSGSPPEALVQECLANDVRVIMVNRRRRAGAAALIRSDDALGADLAFARLRAEGRSRLAVVGPGTGTSSIARRMGRFRARARAAGIGCRVWAEGPNGYETGVAAARGLAACDGIFCATDLVALGLLNTLRHEAGLAVPRDCSVIGFDDIPEAGWAPHRLTTLRQDRGRLARAILAEILADDSSAVRPEGGAGAARILPVALVERGTTLPPFPGGPARGAEGRT